MNIKAPEIYRGKKLKISSKDGKTYIGNFIGWCWDYFEDDPEYGNKYDDGSEHLEISWEDDITGLCCSIIEEEVDRIEIIQ